MESLTETLEKLIDTHGILHVLTGISVVCWDKARLTDDLKESDKWDRASINLDMVTSKIERIQKEIDES
jgi:hypothetical protein